MCNDDLWRLKISVLPFCSSRSTFSFLSINFQTSTLKCYTLEKNAYNLWRIIETLMLFFSYITIQQNIFYSKASKKYVNKFHIIKILQKFLNSLYFLNFFFERIYVSSFFPIVVCVRNFPMAIRFTTFAGLLCSILHLWTI